MIWMYSKRKPEGQKFTADEAAELDPKVWHDSPAKIVRKKKEE